jgi:hypothetical protein
MVLNFFQVCNANRYGSLSSLFRSSWLFNAVLQSKGRSNKFSSFSIVSNYETRSIIGPARAFCASNMNMAEEDRSVGFVAEKVTEERIK